MSGVLLEDAARCFFVTEKTRGAGLIIYRGGAEEKLPVHHQTCVLTDDITFPCVHHTDCSLGSALHQQHNTTTFVSHIFTPVHIVDPLTLSCRLRKCRMQYLFAVKWSWIADQARIWDIWDCISVWNDNLIDQPRKKCSVIFKQHLPGTVAQMWGPVAFLVSYMWHRMERLEVFTLVNGMSSTECIINIVQLQHYTV